MPFANERQRRYLWANKPELAKKWSATYKFWGGSIDDNSSIDEFGVDVEEQLPTGYRIPLETQELVGSFVPGIGTAVGLRDAAKDYEEGNWGNLALTAGLSALGPLGSAVNKRIQGARRAGLGWTENVGDAGSIHSKFKGNKAEEIMRRSGLPDTPANREMVSAYMQDAGRAARGVQEVGTPSVHAKGWEAAVPDQNMQVKDSVDVVKYNHPPPEIQKQMFPEADILENPLYVSVGNSDKNPISVVTPDMVARDDALRVHEAIKAVELGHPLPAKRYVGENRLFEDNLVAKRLHKDDTPIRLVRPAILDQPVQGSPKKLRSPLGKGTVEEFDIYNPFADN